MSTSITEYHINIDGLTMTPAQLFEFARGLVEAEEVGHEADQAPDTWEIELPMRYQTFMNIPIGSRERAECITVLAYHLWQLEERLTGGDGSHKSCDPIRIGYDGKGWFDTYSYVFPELDHASFGSLELLEKRLLEVFTARMTNLLAIGRKRAGVKW